jgi:uncharacterized protein YukE
MFFRAQEAGMTIIEMDTDAARGYSTYLGQYINDLRGIKNELINNNATVANNWQSRGSNEFQILMQEVIAEMEGKLANLEGLKGSLDSSISANEEVARKFGP